MTCEFNIYGVTFYRWPSQEFSPLPSIIVVILFSLGLEVRCLYLGKQEAEKRAIIDFQFNKNWQRWCGWNRKSISLPHVVAFATRMWWNLWHFWYVLSCNDQCKRKKVLISRFSLSSNQISWSSPKINRIFYGWVHLKLFPFFIDNQYQESFPMHVI